MAAEARQLARTGNQPAKKTGKKSAKGTNTSKGGAKAANRPARLTFRDQHALDRLPGEIEQLAAAIAKLEAAMADPALFTTDPEKFKKAATALATAQAKKEEKETQWLEVAERAEALEGEDAQP
jgi:ATP-binding cassette subfamily F protein uup